MEYSPGQPIRSFSDYQARHPELEAYLTGQWLTDLANFSSFVFHALPRLNWAGFYLSNGRVLQLGAFVGRPACTEIRPGRGVCGTAFSQQKALIVPDVDQFPGHIVCDNASRSELVVPFVVQGECLGVFDLDSPDLARFQESDREGIELWLGSLAARISERVQKAKPWAI